MHLEIGQNAYVQNIDMSVSPDSLLKFNSLGALNRTINFDGNGHGLFIARNKPGVIKLDAGVNAIVRNTVLSGFDDASVTLGKGARLTFGDGAVVELASDVAMQRDWECTGRVTVRGFGSALDLSTFSIVLKKDANGQAGQLILEDIVLAGVSTNSLNLVDESSVVTLRDVRMNMAGMTTFTHGALRIERNVTMSGQHAFSFVANNPLNIAANSALNIDSGTVFVYAPASGDRSLLVMKDSSSQLILNGSYFYAPAPGIQLSNGTLVVRSNNNIYNHGAKTLADAITFGNGILANNLFIDIQPGASLNVIEGKLDYRNTGS